MIERPEGWYPDQHHPGLQRYWDGAEWTDIVAPAERRYSGMLLAGIISALVLPIVGFVIGVVLASKEQIMAGLVCMGVALVATIVWAAILL